MSCCCKFHKALPTLANIFRHRKLRLQDKLLALQELLQTSEQTQLGFERTLQNADGRLQQYKRALARERSERHQAQASSELREARHTQEVVELRRALAKEEQRHNRTKYHLDICNRALDSEHKVGLSSSGHGYHDSPSSPKLMRPDDSL